MGNDEHGNAEMTKPKTTEKQSLRNIVDDELTKVGSGGPWVW